MSDTKHSPALPSAILTGAETLPVMQGGIGGVLRKTTTGDIAALVAATLTATAGEEATNEIVLSIQSNKATTQTFWLELVSVADASYAVSATTGTILYDNSTLKSTLVQTDASGLAEIVVTDMAAEDILLAYGGGPGTSPIVGGTITLTFA